MPRVIYPAQIRLDASGNGTAVVPFPGDSEIVTTSIAVSVATAVKQPTANLYLNLVSPTALLEGSYSGANDSSNTRHLINPGDSLYCVWTGGDANAMATAVVTGISVPIGQGVKYLGGT